MPYVMEKVSVFENDALKVTNFIVKDDLFYCRDAPVGQYNFIRLHLDRHHAITACDTVVADLAMWVQRRTEYVKELVLHGSVTVIFPVDIHYEYQFDDAFRDARLLLKDFPLDHVLILKAPAAIVTPSLIRKCRINHVPALIVKFGHTADLQRVDWSRVREAGFPYNLVYVPEFMEESLAMGQAQWKRILNETKLSHSLYPLSEHTALSKDMLKKIGLYPNKGILRTGGEVSYHILKENNAKCLNNNRMAYYDKIEATVYKNKVLRYGDHVDLSAADGIELEIKVPGYFK